jgi:hypothetical protein
MAAAAAQIFLTSLVIGTLIAAWLLNKDEIKLAWKSLQRDQDDHSDDPFRVVVQRVRAEQEELDSKAPPPRSWKKFSSAYHLVGFCLIYVTRLPVMPLHFSLLSRFGAWYTPAKRATCLALWDSLLLVACFLTSWEAFEDNAVSAQDPKEVPFVMAIAFAFLVMLTNVYDCFSIFVPGVRGTPLVRKAPHRVPLYGLVVQGAIIILSFAAAYHALSRLDECAFCKTMSPVESAYFSLITAATVGYGDIYPKTQTAMLFVMAEVAVGWAYTVFAVASVVSVKLTQLLGAGHGGPESGGGG